MPVGDELSPFLRLIRDSDQTRAGQGGVEACVMLTEMPNADYARFQWCHRLRILRSDQV